MKSLLKFRGTLPELVDAMAAAEVLVNATKGTSIYWKVEEKYIPVVKGAWYTKGAAVDVDESHYDLVLDLIANQEQTHLTELAWRKNMKDLVDARIAQVAQMYNIDESDIPKPADYPTLTSTAPIWGRIMGYVVGINEQSKTSSCGITESSATVLGVSRPFLPQPRHIRETINKYLHANRDKYKPGAPFVVVGDRTQFESRDLEILVPSGWSVVYIDEDTDPQITVGLMTHKLCKGVFSWVGGLSHIGWAADLPMIVEITDDPKNAYWSCSMSDSSVTIDLADKQTTPDTFRNSLREIYKYAHGVELM